MSKKVYAPDGRRVVFRVQSRTCMGEHVPKFKAGAYNWSTGPLIDHLCEERKDSTIHPTPYSDQGLADVWDDLLHMGVRDSFLFGFRDVDQLTNWFMWPDLMRRYSDIAEIGVYLCDEVHDGQFQSIFDSRDAEYLCDLPLNTTYYNPETGETHAN